MNLIQQGVLLLTGAVMIISCQPTASNHGNFDLSGYETANIDGVDAVIATKRTQDGTLVEQGTVIHGTKTGTWTTFHDDGRIKTIQNFVHGEPNGLSLELSSRGQIEKKDNILNGQLNGEVTTYKFGRPLKSYTYKNGKLDGPFVEYTDRGKMQKQGSFKNGQQHGTLQFFGEEENLIMEYEYKNGEKVSGGMIEKKSE